MAVFDSPINTNDQSFERVLAAGLPVVLVFLDEEPREDLKEVMKRAARQNAGDLLVAKINRKENPTAAGRYNISRAPAVVTVRDNQVQSKAEPISGRELEQHIDYLLGRGPKPSSVSPPPRPSYQSSPAAPPEGRPLIVGDSNFDQEVMNASGPVLVDFWAPWCGPCRITEPIVEKIAQEMSGRLKVAKVNVDENPSSAQRFDVRSIPTMMIVKNGQIVDRWVGALPEAAMRSRVSAKI
jgi:thioredoxin 1